ncbi:MAG: hypothetical protein GIW95_08210 [Candidatus Eremiobacteraeota bacterium]|nr:hypothetical protein [Candidatus Eremiobacteraeota bacterium]
MKRWFDHIKKSLQIETSLDIAALAVIGLWLPFFLVFAVLWFLHYPDWSTGLGVTLSFLQGSFGVAWAFGLRALCLVLGVLALVALGIYRKRSPDVS